MLEWIGQADGTLDINQDKIYWHKKYINSDSPVGTQIKERRFTLNISIADEGAAMDILNTICSTFRGALVYSLGKLTLAVDMPDEFPVMAFQ